MKHVGNFCQTLLAPAPLRTALVEIGSSEQFLSRSILFHAGDKNAGIFLVNSGEVCLQVPGVPQLSRTFSIGSILGLPSTFSEKPYSLTAVSATDCGVISVGKKKFLDLMKEQPELCREATDILVREIAFIYSAIREQHKAVAGEAGIPHFRSRAGAKAVNQ